MQPYQFLIRHKFQDFDHFAQTAREWNLNIRQLERGSFEGNLLQYAFRKRFGMPPKSYLLAMRLNGVRRGLKNADTTSSTITDLATQWGLWHMSQFAADYRRLFGELPSETMHRHN